MNNSDFKPNEPFRAAMKQAEQAHHDLLRIASSRFDILAGDASADANYMKAICVIASDNINALKQIREQWYSVPTHFGQQLFEQCIHRASVMNFIATDNLSEVNERITACYDYVQDIGAKMQYAHKLLLNPPDDFTAFDRAWQSLGKLRTKDVGHE